MSKTSQWIGALLLAASLLLPAWSCDVPPKAGDSAGRIERVDVSYFPTGLNELPGAFAFLLPFGVLVVRRGTGGSRPGRVLFWLQPVAFGPAVALLATPAIQLRSIFHPAVGFWIAAAGIILGIVGWAAELTSRKQDRIKPRAA